MIYLCIYTIYNTLTLKYNIYIYSLKNKHILSNCSMIFHDMSIVKQFGVLQSLPGHYFEEVSWQNCFGPAVGSQCPVCFICTNKEILTLACLTQCKNILQMITAYSYNYLRNYLKNYLRNSISILFKKTMSLILKSTSHVAPHRVLAKLSSLRAA